MTDVLSVSDKVNAIACAMGFTPTRVNFENTAFLLGWAISNTQFRLIYRVEGDTLIVCSLEACRPRSGLETTLLPLMQVWQHITARVPEVMKMQAMIRRSGPEASRQVRQKMVTFLQQQGACVRHDGDEQWVELPR